MAKCSRRDFRRPGCRRDCQLGQSLGGCRARPECPKPTKASDRVILGKTGLETSVLGSAPAPTAAGTS